MKISGFQKLTLLDYPGKIACIIFTQGCNFKCTFCQNSDLIKNKDESIIKEQEILDYLEKRKKVIDGIVISGGEPTIQKDLKGFCKKVKDLNLLVKLDTNGSNPSVIKDLIDNHLIDYVAMDIKNIFNEYKIITDVKNINTDNIKKSIKLLQSSPIDYEFRTTIMKNYHDLTKIKKICKYLGKDTKYFLQNFEDSEYVLSKQLIPFSKEELVAIRNEINKEYPNVKVRGI